MRKRLIGAAVVGIAAALAAGGARAEVFVYPKKDQSQQQFAQDQFQCHGWAKQQTGVDPARIQDVPTLDAVQARGALVRRCFPQRRDLAEQRGARAHGSSRARPRFGGYARSPAKSE